MMRESYSFSTLAPKDLDPLDEVFHLLQMKNIYYLKSQLNEPWGVKFPEAHNIMMFHLVTSGECLLKVGRDSIQLFEGDFIIFPGGSEHELKSNVCSSLIRLQDLPTVEVSNRLKRLTYGGSGKRCDLLCGGFYFDHPIANKFIDMLPKYIHIGSNEIQHPCSFNNLMNILTVETQQLSLGSETVITRITDVILVNALRNYLARQNKRDLNWLSGLKDKRIGKSLAHIHENPGHTWTLSSLASKVGMSRTAYSVLFKEVLGVTAIDYLTDWRMSLAYKQFAKTNESVLKVAMDLGYRSESSFSRAFRKTTGLTPREVRKRYAREHKSNNYR